MWLEGTYLRLDNDASVEVPVKPTPKHRIERPEAPWWWFGQPWARPQAEQEMDDEAVPAGDVAVEEDDDEWSWASAESA